MLMLIWRGWRRAEWVVCADQWETLGLVFVVGDLEAETAASGSIPCGRRVCKAVRETLEAGRIS